MFPQGQVVWAPPQPKEGTALHRADCSSLVSVKSGWLAQMHVLEGQQNQPREQQQSLLTPERHHRPWEGPSAALTKVWSKAKTWAVEHKHWSDSQDIGALFTTTKHFLWPQFSPLSLRRIILNIDTSTTNLYSERWKMPNSMKGLNWQGEGKSILYFHSYRLHQVFVFFPLQSLENPTCPPILPLVNISSDPMETAQQQPFGLQLFS